MKFDVIVIGGGHAGCEAAHAAARLGCGTAMILPDKNDIARMSCNPAVGGPGKSQIVREIDALGGLMARVADMSGLQYRTLNAGKGPAVRANRTQADTKVYRQVMRGFLADTANLRIVEGRAVSVETKDGCVTGIGLESGETLFASAVIVSTGTFLNGLLHTGFEQKPGGRHGEPPAVGLSDSLKKLGFCLARLKTGTPPRLNKNSIDFSKLEIQPGDVPPRPFSFFTDKINRPAMPCHITWTNEKTHEVIRKSFDRSPLFTGVIQGVGPRYCPSIEDKVVRFPERGSHHIFLEPVAQNSDQIYPNGISTSLPADVQREFVQTITGLEEAEIITPGYAVEYDFAPPTQIYPTLETKPVSGLFFAGQINGTSGYEEAGGQGILAGINAARKLREKEQIILDRRESYIGVMVDDLTTLGTQEPYRMFTSRAEHRLVMRQDNADTRLCRLGHDIGLLPADKYEKFTAKQKNIDTLIKRFRGEKLAPDKATLELLEKQAMPAIKNPMTLAQYIRRPDVSVGRSPIFGELAGFAEEEIERAEIEIKYEGYIERQKKWIKELEGIEHIPLSADIDYRNIPGLSAELAQKFEEIRPLTFGQASRISGITPAALSIMMIYLKTKGRSAG